MDLPWNPAVLEQRVARAHRMGQARQVSVFLLITEGTLEENLLATLAAKRDLALAALDAESSVSEVDVRTGADELKRRLEILLGAKPEAPVDRVAVERAGPPPSIADAGNTLIRAAFSFLSELAAAPRDGAGGLGALVDAKLELREDGRRRFSMSLPSEAELGAVVRSLAPLFEGMTRQDRT